MPATVTTSPPSSTSPPPSRPSAAVLGSRWTAFGLCLALVLLGLLWELRWAPLVGGTGALAIKVIPLVLALPGLWRMRLYTYRWLSLAVWLYVAEGLVRATSDAGLSAQLAWIYTALAIALFVACAWHVRARLRAGKALQEQTLPPAPTKTV